MQELKVLGKSCTDPNSTMPRSIQCCKWSTDEAPHCCQRLYLKTSSRHAQIVCMGMIACACVYTGKHTHTQTQPLAPLNSRTDGAVVAQPTKSTVATTGEQTWTSGGTQESATHAPNPSIARSSAALAAPTHRPYSMPKCLGGQQNSLEGSSLDRRSTRAQRKRKVQLASLGLYSTASVDHTNAAERLVSTRL